LVPLVLRLVHELVHETKRAGASPAGSTRLVSRGSSHVMGSALRASFRPERVRLDRRVPDCCCSSGGARGRYRTRRRIGSASLLVRLQRFVIGVRPRPGARRGAVLRCSRRRQRPVRGLFSSSCVPR
jgi:hypothetical protein